MHSTPELSQAPRLPLPAGERELQLRCFTYEDRRLILPALAEAMTACGCWLLDRRLLSLSQTEFRFEMQLRAAVDLYSSLIGAGLEMTRDSHMDLTRLCTLRKHSRATLGLGQVVCVHLELSFLDDSLPLPVQPASARA